MIVSTGDNNHVAQNFRLGDRRGACPHMHRCRNHPQPVARRKRGRAGRAAGDPGRGRDREPQAAPGSGRVARHRDADCQRGDQGAPRNRDHPGAFPGRSRGQAGRSAVHPRQPADRGRDQAGRGDHRRRAGATATGRARRRALHRVDGQERDHGGHPQQRPDPGQYSSGNRRVRARRPWTISRFSSNTPGSARRFPGA